MTTQVLLTAEAQRIRDQILAWSMKSLDDDALMAFGFSYAYVVRRISDMKVVFQSAWFSLENLPKELTFVLRGRASDMRGYLRVKYRCKYTGDYFDALIHLTVLIGGGGAAWDRPAKVDLRAAVKEKRRTPAWNRIHTEIAKRSRSSRESRRPSNAPSALTKPFVGYGVYPKYMAWGDGTVTENTTATYINSYRDWAGTTTPGYRDKLKRGALPSNSHWSYQGWARDNCFLETFSHETEVSKSWVVMRPVQSEFGGRFPSGPAYPVVFDTSGRNRALAKLAKAAGQECNNVANDLAEIRQSIEMITSSARKLTNAIRAVKGGNILQAAKELGTSKPRVPKHRRPDVSQNVANNWLELQYGWKPLLADIHGVMESIARANRSNVVYQKAVASTRVEKHEVVPIRPNGYTADIGVRTQHVAHTSKFIVRFTVADQLKSFLAQTGFTNPINLGWELLPYSFVVDWFMPIGPYLEGLTQWDGLSFKDGCEIQFSRVNTFYALNYRGAKPFGWEPGMYYVKGNFHDHRMLYNRIALTSFPSMTFPRLKSPFSTGHALNALALMRNAFK